MEAVWSQNFRVPAGCRQPFLYRITEELPVIRPEQAESPNRAYKLNEQFSERQ
jgi:hypothetical protein